MALQFTCIIDGVQYNPRRARGRGIEWNVRLGCVHGSELRRCQLLLLKNIVHGLGDLEELCLSNSWVVSLR